MNKSETQKYVQSLQRENKELKEQIYRLESELSAKETKNGLCGEKSDYKKLMEEILSYEPTNKEDDVALFNYHAIRSFYNSQDKKKNKPHIHIIGLRKFGGEQYMRFDDVRELIKELESKE